MDGIISQAPEGHDAAMIAKSDANDAAMAALAAGNPAPTDLPAAPQRPDDVPEKFWDAKTGTVNTAALLKSYSELEKSRSSAPAKPAAADTQQATQTAAADAAVKDAVGPAKFQAFSDEFAENGELSAESYAALEEQGIPKHMVDAYIAGQTALSQATVSEGYALVGGQSQYSQMTDWAAKNMTQAEINAFDSAVIEGNPAVMKQAILGLKSRFEAAYGSSETGMVNGAQPASDSRGYASTAEMTADMNDPRYARDPAFRRQVELRLEATTAF
jgi:hypothetical protein